MSEWNEDTTTGEKYEPAMDITDQAEADAYFERLVAHQMLFSTTRQQAELIERSNLAYWAGYYGNDTRMRVERLFRCAHPIFGAIAKLGPPTAEQALALGHIMAAGEQDQHESE